MSTVWRIVLGELNSVEDLAKSTSCGRLVTTFRAPPPGGPATGDRARRALDDLDLLGVEVFAYRDARVAHAVAVHVIVGLEAADVDVVPEGAAALAEAQRHARRLARQFADGGGIGGLQHFLDASVTVRGMSAMSPMSLLLPLVAARKGASETA